jgi:hypothetical protein
MYCTTLKRAFPKQKREALFFFPHRLFLLEKRIKPVFPCFAGKGNEVFSNAGQGRAATRFCGKSPDLATLGSYFPQKP